MTRPAPWRDAFWLAALLAALVAVGEWRPLLPIDESRYASVAWEMWARGDFLVPHINGQPYHHKPPLLFWTIHAGWLVFGVNEWWPKLISPLFAAGTLALTFQLGQRLWPRQPDVARMAPFILLSSVLFAGFAEALMFDVMLSFFVVLGLLGMVVAWQDAPARRGFVLLALGLGGALYAKGPVALLHLLPPALLAPWWMRENPPAWRRWYLGVLLALLAGAAMILAWAVPAGLAGGDEYRRAIFWGQTAGRMTSSFAHRLPWWFYLPWLPLTLAPWLIWPRCWHGFRSGLWAESGFRLAAFGVLFGLVAFSLISGKRLHYLLPLYPLFALLAARALHGSSGGRWTLAFPAAGLIAAGAAAFVALPGLGAAVAGPGDARAFYWGGAVAIVAGLVLLVRRPGQPLPDVRALASAYVVAITAFGAAANVALHDAYDVRGVAEQLAGFENEGRAVAVQGEYDGQWQLPGRLRRPLTAISAEQAPQWLAQHPGGRIVVFYRKDDELPSGVPVVYSQTLYRGRRIAIVGAD